LSKTGGRIIFLEISDELIKYYPFITPFEEGEQFVILLETLSRGPVYKSPVRAGEPKMKRNIKYLFLFMAITLIGGCNAVIDLPGEGDECKGSCADGALCRDDNSDGNYKCVAPDGDTDACGDNCGSGTYCVVENGIGTCEQDDTNNPDTSNCSFCGSGTTCQNDQCVPNGGGGGNGGGNVPGDPLGYNDLRITMYSSTGFNIPALRTNSCLSATIDNPAACTNQWTIGDTR
jgi:hypothetical protein